VLVGVDRGDGAALSRQAAADPTALHLAGTVDEVALGEWYRRAWVLAYPSRYEGFGLPVLEAMAAGVPVVASTAASVPEVVGDAGLLCDPEEARAWRAALASVLSDSARAATLSAAGRARAGAFTWARTAAQTAEVFREAARVRAFES
jgi:alpha-1,3-rhamnosyl/mannosyltransferase